MMLPPVHRSTRRCQPSARGATPATPPSPTLYSFSTGSKAGVSPPSLQLLTNAPQDAGLSLAAATCHHSRSPADAPLLLLLA